MSLSRGGLQGLPLLAQPALRQSYAPIPGKTSPSSHEPPGQWNQATVTVIYQWKNKASSLQENAVLSTWRWCSTADCNEPNDWPRSLLLTVLNILFNLIFITVHSSDSFTLSVFLFPSCSAMAHNWLVLFGLNVVWNLSDCFESFSPLNNVWIDGPLMPSSDVTSYPTTWWWFRLVDCLNICIIMYNYEKF